MGRYARLCFRLEDRWGPRYGVGLKIIHPEMERKTAMGRVDPWDDPWTEERASRMAHEIREGIEGQFNTNWTHRHEMMAASHEYHNEHLQNL